MKFQVDRRLLNPMIAVVGFFVVGVAMVALASAGSGRDIREDLVYDVGIGVFASTAVAAILGLYLAALERREIEATRRQEAAAEKLAARVQEEREGREREWAELNARLSTLGADLNHETTQASLTNVLATVEGLCLNVEALHNDLHFLWHKVDPTHPQPNADHPMVGELMEKLTKQIAGDAEPPAAQPNS